MPSPVIPVPSRLDWTIYERLQAACETGREEDTLSALANRAGLYWKCYYDYNCETPSPPDPCNFQNREGIETCRSCRQPKKDRKPPVVAPPRPRGLWSTTPVFTNTGRIGSVPETPTEMPPYPTIESLLAVQPMTPSELVPQVPVLDSATREEVLRQSNEISRRYGRSSSPLVDLEPPPASPGGVPMLPS